MKKHVSVLLAALLLLCCVSGTFAAIGMFREELNGLSFDRPALPVRLTHTEREEYSTSTRYSYEWKFNTEENTVLSVAYEVYDGGLDIDTYISENRLDRIEGAQTVREADHACFFYSGEDVEGFFLMSEPAMGCSLVRDHCADSSCIPRAQSTLLHQHSKHRMPCRIVPFLG